MQTQGTASTPRIFLLDGASGVGKTSVALALAGECDDITFVRRHTTRPRRGPSDDDEYKFVTPNEFWQMVQGGEFIEYRNFEFGMSYGLSRKDVFTVINEGKKALAITNLGSHAIVEPLLPNITTILLDVPFDVIEARLRKRGTHTAEQIAERLRNASTVSRQSSRYDFVVQNDSSVAETVAQIRTIIKGGANE